MTLGDKLSKLRKENNYTQEQLAGILGVSRQAISKWESNLTYPETDKLIRMSDLFNCWNVQDLSLTARVPFIAIIPGAIMVLYGIVCKIRGKKTYGICAIGISLLLIPIIVIGAAFLICALMTG